MITTTRAEKYRRPHPIGLTQKPGDPWGWFEIPIRRGGPVLRCMASPADSGFTPWEHVSVSLGMRCPTWDEMCMVKDLFFEAEDVVMQFHPAQSEYVNFAKHCLHLWRWTKEPLPRPGVELVGPK